MAIETPTWIYKSKGDKQTASEMNQLAQSVIINAIELSNVKDDVAELSNKTYNPEAYSGMGRVILRKNMVNGVNVLTQSMLSNENTIYILQYDFTIIDDVAVPANCILEFDGGSVSGEHTITGQNTRIDARLIKIFNTDVTLAGSWNVSEAYPEWFGAKGDEVTDDTVSIQKAIDFAANSVTATSYGNPVGGVYVKFLPKTYKVTSSIRINKSNINIVGNNATFYTAFANYGILFIVGSAENWGNNFTNVCFFNSLSEFKIKNKGVGVLAILISGTRNCSVSDILIETQEIGMYTEDSSEFNYTNITCFGCGVSFIFDGRYERTAAQSPLGVSSGQNDCSSGIVINPISYYSQKNCLVACACGNIEVTGSTFGSFAERSEDGDSTLKYELGTFAGKSVIIMPNQSNVGFLRNIKLNNCVFEASPLKKSTCVYVYNQKYGTCIDNVILSDLYLQTYRPMNSSDNIYTTFIETNVIGYNNRINVDNCVIKSVDSGLFYPCFYEELGGQASVTFNNCFPKVAFARGLKRNLYDDMIIKDSKYPDNFTVGTLVDGQGPMIRTYNNEVESIGYKASNWNSGCIGIKLDYEGSTDDLDFYVTVNWASDTKSTTYNYSNIVRYSNSVLPFETNNERRLASIIFTPFDANYVFTRFDVVFGSKTNNDIKIYNLEVGCYKIPFRVEKYNPFY